jgi:hypothetical protein
MSCEHLICAQCAGLVAEGRCPVCRAARSQMHRHGPSLSIPVVVALAVMLLLFLVVVRFVP